jgi:long-chain acyl-CoA synthetase
LGEKIVAIIAWKQEKPLPASKVRKFCATHLDTYKIPRKVITVQEFLYTSGGKIARKAMMDKVEGRDT